MCRYCINRSSVSSGHNFIWNKGFLSERASPVALSLGAGILKQDKEVSLVRKNDNNGSMIRYIRPHKLNWLFIVIHFVNTAITMPTTLPCWREIAWGECCPCIMFPSFPLAWGPRPGDPPMGQLPPPTRMGLTSPIFPQAIWSKPPGASRHPPLHTLTMHSLRQATTLAVYMREALRVPVFRLLPASLRRQRASPGVKPVCHTLPPSHNLYEGVFHSHPGCCRSSTNSKLWPGHISLLWHWTSLFLANQIFNDCMG
jgi:hypothetical protein